MNLVIDEAVEVHQPTKDRPEEKRRQLGTRYPVSMRKHVLTIIGQILLKGDNVSLIQALQ